MSGAHTSDRTTMTATACGFLGIPADECDEELAEDALGEFVKAFGVARDVLLIGQAFGDNGMQHRVQHRDVAAGLDGEEQVTRAGEWGDAAPVRFLQRLF